MRVKLVKDRVKAGKQAINELYNTGYYGRPKGDVLELTLVETAYLLYRSKVEVELDGKVLDFEDFFKTASMRQQYFELKYIVYKDLRERGFYVQPGVIDFRLYPRGGKPGKTPAKSFVYVRSERLPMPLKDLLKSINATENVRKQMILAIVDEESDITFYEVKRADIKGEMESTFMPSEPGYATLLEDRVVVWDGNISKGLYEQGFFGKPLDDERLQLSLVESGYLLEENVIEVHDRENGNVLDFEEFSGRACAIEPEFMLKYRTYRDMRRRSLVPKTGFKFGTHFRLYKHVRSLDKIPHSEYLVHAVPDDHQFTLPVMSRAIRLANSVRKRMLFAVQNGDKCDYIDIGRVKM